MKAEDALQRFLEATLARRRERYVQFIAKAKTRPKFLSALHHELHDCFDRGHVVAQLPASAWSSPAFLFAPKRFAEPVSSLREAVAVEPDSFLAITSDGLFGVHREETREDLTLFLTARRPAA